MSESAVVVVALEPPVAVERPVRRAAAASPLELPSGRALLGAAAGWMVAGAAAGLGASAPEVAVRSVPAGLVALGGALVLSGPALVVGHQYLGLSARPVDLAAGLADGFVRSGRAALGFAPLLVFFALTTSLWFPLALVVGAVGGLVALLWGIAGLRRAETSSPRMDALVVGWGALATLVALRLTVDVAWAVLG